MDCMQFFVSRHVRRELQFQYRKRYGLHAIRRELHRLFDDEEFQYRKRYGLHAMVRSLCRTLLRVSRFNTASGMDCMQ